MECPPRRPGLLASAPWWPPWGAAGFSLNRPAAAVPWGHRAGHRGATGRAVAVYAVIWAQAPEGGSPGATWDLAALSVVLCFGLPFIALGTWGLISSLRGQRQSR